MWVTMHKDSPVMSLNTKLARLKIVGASRHALAPEGAGEQGQHAPPGGTPSMRCGSTGDLGHRAGQAHALTGRSRPGC